MSKKTPAAHRSRDDRGGSLAEVGAQRRKRAKTTLRIWVKVRAGIPGSYEYEDDWNVCKLLKEVKAEEVMGVPISNLKLFLSEADSNDPSKA